MAEYPFTPQDLAKYPFIPQASEYVQSLEHRTTDLESPEYSKIVDRAEMRIEEAMYKALVSDQTRNIEIEILSFPIAVMMVVSIKDSSLGKRYALAEANRTLAFLREEKNVQKLTFIAHLFKLKITPTEIYDPKLQATKPGFAIDFVSYLKDASVFHESKWKLVNRTMQRGKVYITKGEVVRLLAEEIKSYVEKKLDSEIDFVVPKAIAERVQKLKELYNAQKGKIQEEEMPKETIIDAFPPCISKLYNTALAKQHLSHIERFTLTTFLLNSGMTVENVIECFRPTSDFIEKTTRYQVEHIAGGRGSRTKYIPPQCITLRTHRICPGRDEICEKVRHPLAYYRKKLKVVKTQTS